VNAIALAARRRHAILLGVLLLAFVFRVAAQIVQAWRPVAWLPPFEAWHSGALPYPALVTAQVVIIAIALWCIATILRGGMRPDRRAGATLRALGWIYAAVMAARLVLGLTVLRQIRWFDSPLPSLFHLVLAAMVLTLASFHRRGPPTPRG
jgi:hypothetical protein